VRDHVLLTVLIVSCASAPAAAPTVCSTRSPPPARVSVPVQVDAGRPDVPAVDAAFDLPAPEPCAEGSLASVLACRKQNCPTEVVHDVTPSALAARHRGTDRAHRRKGLSAC